MKPSPSIHSNQRHPSLLFVPSSVMVARRRLWRPSTHRKWPTNAAAPTQINSWMMMKHLHFHHHAMAIMQHPLERALGVSLVGCPWPYCRGLSHNPSQSTKYHQKYGTPRYTPYMVWGTYPALPAQLGPRCKPKHLHNNQMGEEIKFRRGINGRGRKIDPVAHFLYPVVWK